MADEKKWTWEPGVNWHTHHCTVLHDAAEVDPDDERNVMDFIQPALEEACPDKMPEAPGEWAALERTLPDHARERGWQIVRPGRLAVENNSLMFEHWTFRLKPI